MSDLFHKDRPVAVINQVVETVAASQHIGLLMTKRTLRMAEYFSSKSEDMVQNWQRNVWLGFSAERQQEWNERWPDMRGLADAGWRVFVSVAPLLERVILPKDFLALGGKTWVIVAGEQGPKAECRSMDPGWAEALWDQCKAAGVPFFMKQMSADGGIPSNLHIRQFPSV
jgi:protein gp37